MKKLIILSLLVLTACEKPVEPEPEPDPMVTFWSDDSGPWNVYIDGNRVCQLVVIYNGWRNYGVPKYCNDNRYFTMRLPKGQHCFQMKYVNPPTYEVLVTPIYCFEVDDCTIVRIKQ